MQNRREAQDLAWATRRRRVVGAGGLLLLLAACGGGSDDDEASAVAPGLSIDSDAPGAATGPFTVRFSFSAAVSGFAVNRILISGGFLNGAALTRESDTLYTLVVTPAPNQSGLVAITVQAGAFKDATGAAASTRDHGFSQLFDTVVINNEPTLAISHNAGTGLASGPITFTLSFSTDVAFGVGQFTISGGTITSFSASTARLYSLVVTPSAATTGVVLLRVAPGAFSNAALVSNQQEYAVAVFYATA